MRLLAPGLLLFTYLHLAAYPEVASALARRVPVVPRAEMLGELMRFRYAIAVAGTILALVFLPGRAATHPS